MSCDFDKELISAYSDGELDLPRIAQVETHLKGCVECEALLERLRSLSRAAREPSLYYEAPMHLDARVRASLRESAGVAIPRAIPFRKWLYLAAGVLLAAGLIWTVAEFRQAASEERLIADAAVSDHIRSLLASHLLDVPSTDQHTVKPWFNGRLDFSPDVKDLSSEGFRLTGGRLDYLDGHQVAALVFQRRLHVINLFVWPRAATPSAPAAVAQQHGYNVVNWNTGGMAYWAVSDIPASELLQFAELYRK
jgi:anti-sigma factor RsiW